MSRLFPWDRQAPAWLRSPLFSPPEEQDEEKEGGRRAGTWRLRGLALVLLVSQQPAPRRGGRSVGRVESMVAALGVALEAWCDLLDQVEVRHLRLTTPDPGWDVADVIGHVIAVYLAHLRAGEVFKRAREVLISQYPMLVLMVGYTMTSLWILAQPITRETG